MAHFGALFAASVNVCSDSLYWKECSSASPFSSVGCTSLEHVVGKFTLPSWSAGAAGRLNAHSKKRKANSGIAVLERRASRIVRPPLANKDSTPLRDGLAWSASKLGVNQNGK